MGTVHERARCTLRNTSQLLCSQSWHTEIGKAMSPEFPPSASPQDIFGKVLGATSHDCCNFKHKMWRGGGRRPTSSSRPVRTEVGQILSKAAGLKIPADGYTITQHPIWYLRTTWSSLCHCWPFWLFLLLHIPHFYWSTCISFIIFSLAYSKFLSRSTPSIFSPVILPLISFPPSTVWLSQDYSFKGQLLRLAPKPMIWTDSSQGSLDSAGMFRSPMDPHFCKWFWNWKF